MVQSSQPAGPVAGALAAGHLNQGQQPILNDALSYLDQVKIQFADRPDVYDQFLDIMKEFKSGSIDTPGVIDRVSSLFVDHPDLIQGFNTFLPQGYSIECGTPDNPTSILMTTPSGCSIITINPGRSGSDPRSLSLIPTSVLPPSLQSEGSSSVPFPIPDSQMSCPGSGYDHVHATHYPARLVFSPASAASNLAGSLTFSTVSPLAHTLSGDGERRPVEFNHAISYVNKIKNRFASQPDIYKQFLEILQTYQRESKPIQDVYAQVTRLFESAPDLLDDFKQFLPESASAVGPIRTCSDEPVPISDVRGDMSYRSSAIAPPMFKQSSASDFPRLPPVGTFAPTPFIKETKRKRMDKGPISTSVPALSHPQMPPALGAVPGDSREHPQPAFDASPTALSPTLIPALPEPLAPSRSLMPLPDELAFFDRAKKFIGNRATFTEFLKLLHLFNKDLIDKSVLVYRAHSYIGGNPELYDWFKNFIQYDDAEVIDACSKPTFGRVALSHCRGLGPSYRLLPKRQTHALCKGRDTLCRSVLNDQWISHPTWASEDSGFVAHRKNVYEEGLHRIEEERHDYDFNIEAISRTIQLLQPLAQSLRVMAPADRRAFTLDHGLGGQSQTIYQRVIKRLYGRERGNEIIADLFRRPYAVIPPLLTRLQAKCEDWKAAQREWEKVWREQTQKIFWKSLDHQHAQLKNTDKRQFQAKTLYTEIQVKYEEQKRRREVNKISQPSHQLSFSFPDQSVILDAAHLLLVHADASSSTDSVRLEYFLKEFISLFFAIDPQDLDNRLSRDPNCLEGETYDEDVGYRSGDGPEAAKDLPVTSTMLPPAFSPALARSQLCDSSLAKSGNNGDYSGTVGVLTVDPKPRTWIELPREAPHLSPSEEKAMQPFIRSIFNMYCNLPIYCFFRAFVTFYERLLKLKNDEHLVRDAVRRGQAPKPARDLRMLDKVPEDFWSDTSPNANYYRQVLVMFEDHIHGELSMSDIEETLRRFYLQHGWQLYSFDKLLQALTRFALAIISEDGKDRTNEIYQLFRKDRARVKNTFQDELNYRKIVEKYSREDEIFRLSYCPHTGQAFAAVLKPEDTTLDVNKLETERRWNYYVTSYQTLDPTEGVNYNLLSIPFLRRNIPTDENITDNFMDSIMGGRSDDKLEVRICLNNYRPNFSPHREEWWVANPGVRLVTRQEAARPFQTSVRDSEHRAYAKFVEAPSWMTHYDQTALSVIQGQFQLKFGRSLNSTLRSMT